MHIDNIFSIFLQDLVSLFNMDRLLPLLDLIQKEPYKSDACRSLLETFTRRQKESTCEAVLVSSLMHVSKTMLSFVTALTLDDARKNLANLVCGFISRIEYPDDVEGQLLFFIDARASLGTLDDVLIHLVHAVNRLAVRLQAATRGRHSRKSASHAKACLAYSIVTVPSVYNSTMRYWTLRRVYFSLIQSFNFRRGSRFKLLEMIDQIEHYFLFNIEVDEHFLNGC